MTNLSYSDQSKVNVYPSSQVDSTLPNFIVENYANFVAFMEKADESEERLGFGQNLLQGLQRYRNFDTYEHGIVEYGILSSNLGVGEDTGNSSLETNYSQDIVTSQGDSILTDDSSTFFTLEDGYGFPETNGVVLIGEEVILYRKKEGNLFTGLTRGASGTTVLQTFTSPGKYVDSPSTPHTSGSVVHNLSVLFLSAMLETITESFTDNLYYKRIAKGVNKSALLQNIRDFYQSKGSKLGIKSLFKMLFAQNEVEVSYPGDRMIIPSDSGWFETLILRVVPVPTLLCDPKENNVSPLGILGAEMLLKSYLDDDAVYARTFCNYVSVYPYNEETQYELYVNEDFDSGDFIPNPESRLTRPANAPGTPNDNVDVTTITVESTLGFPDSGVIFIENEGISYTSKTFNQFIGCKRGYIGVTVTHPIESLVYGPYYIEARYKKDDEVYVSRSWPLGLAQKVKVEDPGLLHSLDDDIFINGPGRVNPREQALASFIENYTDTLAEVAESGGTGTSFSVTAGVSGVYFDAFNIFSTSSTFPYYPIGPFTEGAPVGRPKAYNSVSVLPAQTSIKYNPFKDKGTHTIGVFVDGVPAYSNNSNDRLYQGRLAGAVVLNKGGGYVNPTLVINNTAKREAVIELTADGGIASIDTDPITKDDYNSQVTSRISGGEGAEFTLKFTGYGTIKEVTIDDGGKWYYGAIPIINVVDTSGIGKGAILRVTSKSNGVITGVEIVDGGIDYQPSTTTAEVLPLGEGAEVFATVQYYTFDRYKEILDHDDWFLDSGNGFLYPATNGALERTQYGYIGYPKLLAAERPQGILGWAFDGNPIYGPLQFKNEKDDTDGYVIYISGYRLKANRNNIIAGGGLPGTLPPTKQEYAMGTFIQDYKYDADNTLSSAYDILTDNPDTTASADPPNNAYLETDPDNDKLLAVLTGSSSVSFNLSDTETAAYVVCDENNGAMMNTPEFPKELYPDGVYCYIATAIGSGPIFPYIIGPNFTNRPISQSLKVIDEIEPVPITYNSFDPEVPYDTTQLEFDFTKINRFRNPYLEETKDELKDEIADVSTGSVSSIEVISGYPSTSKVGDLAYFDDAGTGGAGAEGIVSQVKGENVVRSFGSVIATQLISHKQKINLNYWEYSPQLNMMVKPDFTFVPDTLITTTTESIAQVLGKHNVDPFNFADDPDNYNYETRVLTVQTDTKRLIQPGDVFYDNEGKLAVVRAIGMNAFMGEVNVKKDPPFTPVVGQFYVSSKNRTAKAPDPGEGTVGWVGIAGERVNKGEVIVCVSDGTTEGYTWIIQDQESLYDTVADHGAMKIKQAIEGYLHLGGGEWLLDEDGYFHLELEQNLTITIRGIPTVGSNLYISSEEPPEDTASDGDLWWSINTGRFYVFFRCKASYMEAGQECIRSLGQWVCTQPIGTRPMNGAIDYGPQSYYRSGWATNKKVFHQAEGNTISIANRGPTQRQDGYPNQLGDLWWSSATGILYIWNTNAIYNLSATDYIRSEWVATDPTGSYSSIVAGSDETSPHTSSIAGTFGAADSIYSANVTTLISPDAPEYVDTAQTIPVTDGMLWWSCSTGKLHVYYTDNNGTSQWVITSPIGTISGEGSLDIIPDGSGGSNPNPIYNVAESAKQRWLWFDNYDDFYVGDTLRFEISAPGLKEVLDAAGNVVIKDSYDTALIKKKGLPYSMKVIRDDSPSELPDRCPVINDSRALYTVITSVPHNLLKGDIVNISNSLYDEVNASHVIYEVGTAVAPIATPTIDPTTNEVEDLIFSTDSDGNEFRGSGYAQDFYITFYGGGGTGALFYAEVSPLVENEAGDLEGGEVTKVTVQSGGQGYTDIPIIVWGSQLTTSQFTFYTLKPHGIDPNIKYCTPATQIINQVCEVDVLSPGIGYNTLPVIRGIIKKEIDRARVTVSSMNGTQVETISVSYGGSRYEDPIAIITDVTGNGSGATASVSIDQQGSGSVVSVNVTNGGSGYVEPVVSIVDPEGKYLPLTKDIGQIKALKVTDPGRNISPDRSLKPELQIETKAIIKFTSSGNVFATNTEYRVYQGTPDYKFVTATVTDYDEENQIITLKKVEGVLKSNEEIFTEQITPVISGTLLLEGQADCSIVVNGISGTLGRFMNDESMLSRKYAVIQDSRYFQWFSYEISSPMQQVDYVTFVRDIIHPVGFALFSGVTITESVSAYVTIGEMGLNPPAFEVLGTDGLPVGEEIIGFQGYYGADTMGAPDS
ncbi:MAG: hypothetical protein CL779_00825 [Chloroflexi bacterium]|nr:hypothetical protein [Chloroflexota bacterium]